MNYEKMNIEICRLKKTTPTKFVCVYSDVFASALLVYVQHLPSRHTKNNLYRNIMSTEAAAAFMATVPQSTKSIQTTEII